MSSTAEVRQCPKCDQPAVLMVMDWVHLSSTGARLKESTRDYRCQSCATWFIRRSSNTGVRLWIVGVLILLCSLPGIPFLACLVFASPFFYLAWQQHRFEQRLPVVRGAPEPQLRFHGGVPKRTCGKCGGVAQALEITRYTHDGSPMTGTFHRYQCSQCGLKFVTVDLKGHLLSAFSTLFLGGILAGGFVLGRRPPLFISLSMGILAAFVLFLLGQTAWRILNRFKHKAIDG